MLHIKWFFYLNFSTIFVNMRHIMGPTLIVLMLCGSEQVFLLKKEDNVPKIKKQQIKKNKKEEICDKYKNTT